MHRSPALILVGQGPPHSGRFVALLLTRGAGKSENLFQKFSGQVLKTNAFCSTIVLYPCSVPFFLKRYAFLLICRRGFLGRDLGGFYRKRNPWSQNLCCFCGEKAKKNMDNKNVYFFANFVWRGMLL